MTASDHPFDAYVTSRRGDLRLAEASLLFALDRYPDLCVASHLQQLDALAARVEKDNPKSSCDRIAAMREILVGQERFLGDAEDYYDPCNSYLNRVLSTRRGLPITLSAIWLDIAATLGWSFVGIGLPGHFVIGCPSSEGHVIVDPFSGGTLVGPEACRDLLFRVFGGPVELTADHLAPVDSVAILTRMLNNLRSCYLANDRWHCAAMVIRRMLVLRPEDDNLQTELVQVETLHAQQN